MPEASGKASKYRHSVARHIVGLPKDRADMGDSGNGGVSCTKGIGVKIDSDAFRKGARATGTASARPLNEQRPVFSAQIFGESIKSKSSSYWFQLLHEISEPSPCANR